MKLSPFDVQRIIKTLPSDIIKQLKESSGRLFLAGGFIRASIAGEKINDIDLWGCSRKYLDDLSETLQALRDFNGKTGKTIRMRTDNAFTLLTPNRLPVQYITRWVFDKPEDCCNSFDFTIASAAVWWNAELRWHDHGQPRVGGWDSYCAETFYRDLASKSLVYTMPSRNEDAGGSFMRLQKFMHLGYSISPGNLAAVVARLVSKVHFKSNDDEPHIARVILGLLREVDPLVVVDGVELLNEDPDTGDKEADEASSIPPDFPPAAIE